MSILRNNLASVVKEIYRVFYDVKNLEIVYKTLANQLVNMYSATFCLIAKVNEQDGIFMFSELGARYKFLECKDSRREKGYKARIDDCLNFVNKTFNNKDGFNVEVFDKKQLKNYNFEANNMLYCSFGDLKDIILILVDFDREKIDNLLAEQANFTHLENALCAVNYFNHKEKKLFVIAEQAIENINKFKLIIKQTPTPVAVFDEDMEMVVCSYEFSNNFANKNKDINLNHLPTKNEKFYNHFTPYIKEAIFEKKEISKIEYLSLTQDSSMKKYYDWKLKPITINNKQEVFVIIHIENVSEKISLENSVNILKKHNEELENFSRICAHDLKEPLRSIYSFLELLEIENKDCFSDVSINYLNIIYQSTINLQNLIDKLGSYTKLTAREQQLEAVDLDQVLSDVTFLLAHKIYSSKAKIIYKNLDFVYGDKVMITQLFQNLIDNAIKHRGKDLPIVEITKESDKENIIISIKDNGKAIKKKEQKIVFDLFVKGGDESNSSSSGIGLALCKKIMDRHNGRIWLHSDGKSGTIFNLMFKKHYLQK